MLNYEFLRFIWWLLIGVLLLGFCITDGFDMGVLLAMPFMGKTNTEKRVLLNAIGPVWEGNQTWLVTAAGAMFAAWPQIYATSFSGFYVIMILALAALFFRPVGFEYRGRVEQHHAGWIKSWDLGLFIAALVPTFGFGLLFGNILEGLPFKFSNMMSVIYTGAFWQLFTPFALLTGLLSTCMLLTQGGAWLQLKTTGEILERARILTRVCAIFTMIIFAGLGLWLVFKDGYIVKSVINPKGPSTQLGQYVIKSQGAWFRNYDNCIFLYLIPLLVFIGGILNVVMTSLRKYALVFFFSSLTLLGIIFSFGISMFPFIMPSSIDPSASLLMWNATSGQLVLSIMFWVAIVFVVIDLSYTLLAYIRTFGRISTQDIENPTRHLY